MSTAPHSPDSAPVEHSCEHCSTSGGAVTDPAAQAREHIAVAMRRLAPRVVLGVLALGIALVLAAQHDHNLIAVTATFLASALAWLGAAWGGVLLGSLLGSRRGPWARLALGQVLAAGLAPLLALAIALALRLFDLPDGAGIQGDGVSASLQAGLSYGVAAAAGWFFAAAIAEFIRLRALRSAADRQDETGLQARGEAHGLTIAALQRTELVALGVALAFGVAALALMLLPWLALVLAPLAAAGAAALGLRSATGGPAPA